MHIYGVRFAISSGGAAEEARVALCWTLDLHPTPGETEIFLVALCYRKQDKLRPDELLGWYTDFTFSKQRIIYSWVFVNVPSITFLLQILNTGGQIISIKHLGRVVRKPVNVNPGLKVNCSIIFLCLKMFFAPDICYSLRLPELKTAGQTI